MEFKPWKECGSYRAGPGLTPPEMTPAITRLTGLIYIAVASLNMKSRPWSRDALEYEGFMML